MKLYNINKKKYYNANDLQIEYPEIFKGCRRPSEFLKKKDVGTNAIFAKLNDKKWIESSGISKKFDKVFIEKTWFDTSYLNKQYIKIEDAPKIIKLEDNEKFIDDENNIIEIEVRGEREYDKCYFKVNDIMDGFKINRLNDIILDSKCNYENNIHYKFFYLHFTSNTGKKRIKKLYLTYNGLLRVLFASRKKTTDKFINWATKTLFTAQMGSIVQKTKLAGSLLGATSDAVKQVFNKSTRKIPCNYLFLLGQVKDLRKIFKIDEKYDDDSYVSKWGMTSDLERRTKDHENDFGKMKGCKMQLYAYGYIDPQYISEAEVQLKNYMDGMDLILNHEKYMEIAIISKNKLTKVKNQITLISKTYMGHITELIAKIKEKDCEIDLIKKDNELAKKNNELAKKNYELDLMKKDNELAKKNYELDLMKKDYEIIKRDLEIEKLKNNKKK